MIIRTIKKKKFEIESLSLQMSKYMLNLDIEVFVEKNAGIYLDLQINLIKIIFI